MRFCISVWVRSVTSQPRSVSWIWWRPCHACAYACLEQALCRTSCRTPCTVCPARWERSPAARSSEPPSSCARWRGGARASGVTCSTGRTRSTGATSRPSCATGDVSGRVAARWWRRCTRHICESLTHSPSASSWAEGTRRPCARGWGFHHGALPHLLPLPLLRRPRHQSWAFVWGCVPERANKQEREI